MRSEVRLDRKQATREPGRTQAVELATPDKYEWPPAARTAANSETAQRPRAAPPYRAGRRPGVRRVASFDRLVTRIGSDTSASPSGGSFTGDRIRSQSSRSSTPARGQYGTRHRSSRYATGRSGASGGSPPRRRVAGRGPGVGRAWGWAGGVGQDIIGCKPPCLGCCSPSRGS